MDKNIEEIRLYTFIILKKTYLLTPVQKILSENIRHEKLYK